MIECSILSIKRSILQLQTLKIKLSNIKYGIQKKMSFLSQSSLTLNVLNSEELAKGGDFSCLAIERLQIRSMIPFCISYGKNNY